MEIQNQTPWAAGLAIGLGPNRQPCVAVVVKATFRLPDGVGGVAEFSDEQRPLLAEDEHYDGDPSASVRLEHDLVPFKPHADVVLVGSAYAPGGKAVTALDVGLRVGRLQHAARVVGDRRWAFPSRAVLVPAMSPPEPFSTMPLVYERAFGGVDRKGRGWAPTNPVGRGFLGQKTRECVDGRLLPNLEDPRQPIRSWDDRPPPVGFGFVGRTWQPRAALAGTADGLANPDATFGLPSDFNLAFHNGAPTALQLPGYLAGNEEVEMRHLTPDGYRRFRLPGARPEVEVRLRAAVPPSAFDPAPDAAAPPAAPYQSAWHPLTAHLDTLVLLPDEGVLCQTWRATHPLPDLDVEAIEAITVRAATS